MCSTSTSHAPSKARKITFHANGHGFSVPAVNVKDDTLWARDLRTARYIADLSTSIAEAIYEDVREDFWTIHAPELARTFGYGRVYSEGRSGGWLVVETPPDLDACNPCYGSEGQCPACTRWFEFVDAIEAELKDMGEVFVERLRERAAEAEANIVRGYN